MIEKELNEIAESIALNVFHAASDPTNYIILNMMPCTVEDIRRELDMSKIPVYNRVNRLDKLGLLHFARGTGHCEPTSLCDMVLIKMDIVRSEIGKNIGEQVVRIIKSNPSAFTK